ncbi:MAG: hypothetical protein ABI554_15050 [Flavobacterium sp.]
MNAPSLPLSTLKKEVSVKGDTIAYGQLVIAYLNYPPEDFLFWALLMSNKYNYSPAYLDVFFALKNSFNPEADNYSLGEMDENTKNMALKYLKLAVDKKVINAYEILESVKKSNSLIGFN